MKKIKLSASNYRLHRKETADLEKTVLNTPVFRGQSMLLGSLLRKVSEKISKKASRKISGEISGKISKKISEKVEVFEKVKPDSAFQSNRALQNWQSISITGLHDDSRLTGKGRIFLNTPQALPYLSQALRKKPAAIIADSKSKKDPKLSFLFKQTYTRVFLCENLLETQGELANVFYGEPSCKILLIGVTGTNGKTTIAWLLYQLWQKLGYKAGMIGTLGAYWHTGKKEYYQKTGYTTPRTWQIQKTLCQMEEYNIERVVLEASSEGLDLGRLYGLSFHTAVFSGLSQDHLDYHKNIEKYYQAKKKLFMLCRKYRGSLIIAAEDAYGRRLAQEMESYPFLHCMKDFPEFKEKKLPDFLIKNRNLAFQAAALSKKEMDLAKKIVPTLSFPPGRFEILYGNSSAKNDVYGIVDYAHTPDALEKLLLAARGLSASLVCVFGCGGGRDAEKRPLMGAIAARLSDMVFLCDDNPREEDPKQIRSEIKSGFPKDRTSLKEIGKRKKAIYEAVSWAQSASAKPAVVVVAGKGHEEYQIKKNRTIPFSDRKVLKEALCALQL